jgi:hypothetical protein
MLTEILIIAAVVSLGIIVGGRAIVTGLRISRRPTHHLATHTGASPVSPAVDIGPTAGRGDPTPGP